MSSSEAEQSSADISDEMLAEMVRHLLSSWTLEKIERVEEGANSTVALEINTPTGNRRTVLKAITSSHPLAADRARAEPVISRFFSEKRLSPFRLCLASATITNLTLPLLPNGVCRRRDHQRR